MSRQAPTYFAKRGAGDVFGADPRKRPVTVTVLDERSGVLAGHVKGYVLTDYEQRDAGSSGYRATASASAAPHPATLGGGAAPTVTDQRVGALRLTSPSPAPTRSGSGSGECQAEGRRSPHDLIGFHRSQVPNRVRQRPVRPCRPVLGEPTVGK